VIFIKINLVNMKIGIDCHNLESNRTGTGRYLINLLKHWTNKEGVEFFLYFKNKIPKDIPKSNNFQKRILKSNSNALFMHYFLPKEAKKDKINLLFCPNYIAPIFYKGEIALALHDIIYEARPDLFDWPSIFDKILLKKVSKISAKKAKLIFTCSQFSKKEILKYYKVNPKKVFVIPLSANKINYVGSPTSNIKKKYGIQDKFIFYVGTIFRRRFIPETIKAFKKVLKKLPNYQFLVVGRNCSNKKINGNKIIHKKYVEKDDLILLYNSADLVVWLSEYEGFGLPPLEAMACGTPVLSTKKTSLSEVLGDYPIWVKDPKDIKEIKDKIYKILTDKKMQEKLIKKGLEQAKKFSWKVTAKKTLKILMDQNKKGFVF